MIDINEKAALATEKLLKFFGRDTSLVREYDDYCASAFECRSGVAIVGQTEFDSWPENQDHKQGLIRELQTLDGMLTDKFHDSPSVVNADEASSILGISRCKFNDFICGIDFILEIRLSELLIQELSFPRLYAFLIRINGDDHGLERENHGMGYHFHYAKVKDAKRTNVVFTFDREAADLPPPLFWEHHGDKGKIKLNPASFGIGRRLAIYHAAKPSLKSPGIDAFRRPGNEASILYPTS